MLVLSRILQLESPCFCLNFSPSFPSAPSSIAPFRHTVQSGKFPVPTSEREFSPENVVWRAAPTSYWASNLSVAFNPRRSERQIFLGFVEKCWFAQSTSSFFFPKREYYSFLAGSLTFEGPGSLYWARYPNSEIQEGIYSRAKPITQRCKDHQ